MSWRRPIYRWNWRMLRREWRQWMLVIGMIAAAVAAGIVLVASVFNATPPPEGTEMGNGTALLDVDGPASDELLADARAAFDAVDPVENATLRRPGFASPIDVRAFDPDGANSRALIALRDGRYPTAADEIALTRRQLERLGASIGDSLAFERSSFEVTGVVENPSRLSDEFAFTVPGALPPESVRLLITATDDAVDAVARQHPEAFQFGFEDDTRTATTVIVTIAAAIVFLEIGLLVVSIVTMLAQRRRQQLGLLAAAGANRKQLRSAVVSGGALAGLVGAAIGLALGFALGSVIVPLLDGIADRRIETVMWPWPSIVTIGIVAVATTVAAAWWPARRVAGTTVAQSLRAGRPESHRPIVMTSLGVLLVILGVIGLIATFSLGDADRPVYVDAAAFLAVPFGAVLLAPAAIRGWVALAPTRSVASRVALRDIGRFPARSAATAASLVLVLAIPIMGASGFRIFERSPENVASMSPEQLIVRPDSTDVPGGAPGDQSARNDDVAALVGDATAVPLLQPIVETGGAAVGPTIVESGPLGGSTADVGTPAFEEPLVFGTITNRDGRDFGIEVIPTYIGTPELLAALGLDPIGDTDIVTNRDGPHGIVQYLEGDVGLEETMRVEIREFARFESTPGALISPAFAESLGHEIETVGWLIDADATFTDTQIADIGAGAAGLGLAVDAHAPASDGRTTVFIMVVASLLFALGIIAVVGALHRAETASAHTAFEAVGASLRFRRQVHAWTMASLTAVAAVLAVFAGLLSQLGFAREVLGTARLFESIPPLTVATVLLVAPLLSYAFGWSTARQTRSGTDLPVVD